MLKARPYGSEIYDQMADGLRMTRIVDFGWSRQSPEPDRIDHFSLYTLYETVLNCYTAIEVHPMLPTSDCTMTAGGRSLL